MRSKILRTLNVLLVEDEQNLSSLLKNAIGDCFHSFRVKSNGAEGLEEFVRMKPDIVITDIMMPDTTGLEMAKEIRVISKDVPIIILSAFSESDKFLTAIDIGVVKYFIKPFDPDELLEYIGSIQEKFENKVIMLDDGFSFNLSTGSLYKNSRYVSLSKNESKFAELLIENDIKNTMTEDSTIKKLLWADEDVSDERLRTFIKRFRAKTSKDLVVNLKGCGYQIKRP